MRQREREEFIGLISQEGVPLHVARAFLRAGASLHRIAELSCSSEAADRDRVPCPDTGKATDRCLCKDYGSGEIEGTNGHGDVPRINVREAQIESRITKLAAKHGCEAITGGDPRGAVLIIKTPSGRSNDWGGRGLVAG